jgi:curli biogenesis system outer membrane secretion channel CsgG
MPVELSLSGLGDPQARPKMLSVTGADAILFVKVTDLRDYSGRWDDATTGWWGDVSLGIEAKVAARLVSVSSGEVLAASAASGKAEAGTFSGAMGESRVDKGREELTAEAIEASLQALSDKLSRSAPTK